VDNFCANVLHWLEQYSVILFLATNGVWEINIKWKITFYKLVLGIITILLWLFVLGSNVNNIDGHAFLITGMGGYSLLIHPLKLDIHIVAFRSCFCGGKSCFMHFWDLFGIFWYSVSSVRRELQQNNSSALWKYYLILAEFPFVFLLPLSIYIYIYIYITRFCYIW